MLSTSQLPECFGEAEKHLVLHRKPFMFRVLHYSLLVLMMQDFLCVCAGLQCVLSSPDPNTSNKLTFTYRGLG